MKKCLIIYCSYHHFNTKKLVTEISKKFYEIDPKNILALGDYLLIDTTVEELSQNKLDKIPESTGTNIKINESVGKTVIDADGNVAGKIANIDINFDNLEVENVTLANCL